ncbi:hypothetical protein [Sphingobium nicotianae]|uniref:hypothetical protein n=1 Tax=Sphingobium nicotianae TaxID=2782607 RepID=UPI001BE46E88|nr:hypothetical protein [Sphingobium nicotianae]
METIASVSVVRPVSVTVVENKPLQTLLQTIVIAPVGVASSVSTGGLNTTPTTVGPGAGGGGGSAASPISTGSPTGGNGGSISGLVEGGGSLTGTTINGDAVSVSVGSVPGGSAGGGTPVVIAQYN